jgi:hypothetical protein
LRLQGSEHDIADVQKPDDIPLDDLETPRFGLAGFRGSEPAPQYAPIQSNGDDGEAGPRNGPLHTGWQPLFLRQLVLLAFALLFLLLFVSLQIIWSWSQGHQGIATSNDSKHYLWTFGPTAVLVFVTVSWRQVDYAAKSLQPWAEMAKGPATADRSLLLDYVTPFQAVALTRAVRNRHFVVASTITVFFLLKVLTIVSTGLFSLDQVKRNSARVAMQLNNSFTGDNYKHAASVDSRAAHTVYGVQSLNLSYPLGTTAQYAIQLFTPQEQNLSGIVSYTAVADVFSAELVCETGGHVSYTNASDFDMVIGGYIEDTPVSQYYNTSVTTSDFQIHNAHLDAYSWYGNGTDFGYYGIMQNVTCSNLNDNDSKKRRIMFALAYSERTSQDVQAILNSSAVVCIPMYRIQPATITFGSLGVVQDIRLSGQSRRQLAGVSGYDVAVGVMAANQQSFLFSSTADSNLNVTFDTFFNLLTGTTNIETSAVHSLLDPNLLESASQTLYSKIAAQVANRYLVTNDAEPSSSQSNALVGSVVKTEHRLLAKQLPLRLMQGITVVMLCLVILMLLIMQNGVAPRSPESLAAVAAVMARSPSLTKQLKGSGHMDMHRIRNLLSGQRFFTAIRNVEGVPTFFVHASDSHTQDGEDGYAKELDTTHVRWIRPFSMGYAAKTLVVIGPVAVIVALEVTLRLSNANSGLADVNGDSPTRYAWLYLPTLVLVLLGTLFNVLDFDIESLEPFHRLSRGYTDARSTMLQDHLRRIPIATTFHALSNGKYALLAASISILLAPTLTIISSGLFTVQPVPSISTIDNVRAINWFNTTGAPESTEDLSAGMVAGMIVQGNMSYPAWTYDELALPKIELSSNSSTAFMDNGTIVVKTPALRGQVDCTVVPKDLIFSVDVIRDSGISSLVTLLPNISSATGCGNSGIIGQGNNYITININAPITGYFGLTLDLAVSRTSCPPLAVFYGQMINNRTEHFTTLLCTPSVERLEVNATFNVPDLSIASPPHILPNTSSHFSSWYPTLMSDDFQAINVSSSTNLFDSFVSCLFFQVYLLGIGCFFRL